MSPSPPSSNERGYNLVILMVLLAVMSIAIAISLPAWSGVIRRDREEELIFRGLQYAEAIRVFQIRFQRPPIRLQELVEVEPRSIRQLWKDPMTDDGKWVLIPLQGPSAPLTPQTVGRADNEEQEDGNGQEEGEGPEEGGPFPQKDQVQVGPFKGVHSRSNKTSFLVFNGRDRYDEWHFTLDLLINPTAQGQARPPSGPGGDPGNPGGGGLQLSVRWIGRPFPEMMTLPQASGLPDEDSGFGQGSPPDATSGKGDRPRGGTGKP